ncbi:cobyrinate a,c-diamide synthase [Thaumasiovibrio sp. DFM-14]|uniref:cobyrinate a,c-diamide synthase n=1 Tax=Thaumasiovibrio sp. DFM-14 TaxID=3384792 RepID=UPI0039A081A9
MVRVSCPALVVAAPSSGSGKTTIVAAIARYFTNLGKKVRVFKTGPDFIDPAFLALASKHPVYQLDFWMCGERHCKQLVGQAAQEADLILIEGVMGMFDGKCSSADIAAALGIPVLAVIDAGKMAQTFGAIAHGLASFRQDIEMYGVFANRVGSEGHSEMLKASLPSSLKYFGYLPKDLQMTLPERHLGLVQAQELADIEERLDHAASLIANSGDIALPPMVNFELTVATELEPVQSLRHVKIAIAKDQAFSFIYQANIDLLVQMGAQLRYFSPLDGDELPQCDALYLPGGYPELHVEALSKNDRLKQQIRHHVECDKPVIAECGGMLYLNRTLTDVDGNEAQMCGVLNADSVMQSRLAALGLVEGELVPAQTLRGHTFHYSTTKSQENEVCYPESQRGKRLDPVWGRNSVVASYVHWYFPSNPRLVSRLFRGEVSFVDTPNQKLLEGAV